MRKKDKNVLNADLENIKNTLKKEFVGIDKQIDDIIDNIRPWYLFPELIESPVKICLWGMTGSGKTSIVNRIIELLNYKSRSVIISLNNSETKEDNIENYFEGINDIFNGSDCNLHNPIVVLDEFQHLKSINNRQAFKLKYEYWSFIDTGKVKAYYNILNPSIIMSFRRFFLAIKEKYPNYIPYYKNGDFIIPKSLKNSKEIIKNLILLKQLYIESNDAIYREEDFYYTTQSTVDDINDKNIKSLTTETDKDYCYNVFSHLHINAFKKMYIHTYSLYVTNIFVNEKLCNFDSTLSTLEELRDGLTQTLYYDFKSSLIFIMGNLDDIFMDATNYFPDINPDTYHNTTSHITLTDIKDGMYQHYFKPEEVARLGNTHIIFPSFSSKDFKYLINSKLESYKNKIKSNYNVDLIFDKSLCNIIYKEGVSPTEGARNIISNIYEIVETNYAKIICDCFEKVEPSKITYKYKNKYLYIKIEDNNQNIHTLKYKLNTKLTSIRKRCIKDDTFYRTVVHEAGHAVVSSLLNKRIPNKISSVSSLSYFKAFNEYNDTFISCNKENAISYIAEYMGGMAAEEVIFGNYENGNSQDLKEATELASSLYRRYGFGEYKGTIYPSLDYDNKIVETDISNKEMQKILEDGFNLAKTIIFEHQPLLLDMAKYLVSHDYMYPKTIKNKIIKYVPDWEDKIKDNKNFCKNAFESKLKELDI